MTPCHPRIYHSGDQGWSGDPPWKPAYIVLLDLPAFAGPLLQRKASLYARSGADLYRKIRPGEAAHQGERARGPSFSDGPRGSQDLQEGDEVGALLRIQVNGEALAVLR